MADAFKTEMTAAGVPDTVATAIIGAGYDCKDTFLASVVDGAALDTLATSILVGKVEGLKAENATIHPSTGKLRKWFKQVLAECAEPTPTPGGINPSAVASETASKAAKSSLRRKAVLEQELKKSHSGAAPVRDFNTGGIGCHNLHCS